ncbi:hypothetical protein A6A06_25895 [Streptomyces sp. CB02923]|uniref:glycosyltransferase n=1 Tax=Streptomyces sp. CB02923 TaxID=1718985 RepID=UPI00093A5C01|nr:glycosyltransferase [Streptomyces sp. CB02923]OKH99029.1 hypothetical protein A6A06_25895 [Streptomyces sp. CB02923]
MPPHQYDFEPYDNAVRNNQISADELHRWAERSAREFTDRLAVADAGNGPKADPDLIPCVITKDRRVTVVARPRPSPAPARNTALNYVRAPRVTFINDDDRIPPQSLAVRNERAIDTESRLDRRALGRLVSRVREAVDVGVPDAGGSA